MDGLTVGRVVHYVLNANDAQEINARHQAGNETPIGDRIPGIQYHVGNSVQEGKHCAMMITEIWNADGMINGKVLLDSQDDHWVTSRFYSDVKEPGSWHWIEKA